MIASILAVLIASLPPVSSIRRKPLPPTFAYSPRSDGTIARFTVDRATGRLTRLTGTMDTGIRRPFELTLSADRRFLYACRSFNRTADGYNTEELDDKKRINAAITKPTPITVFAIARSGALRRIQMLTVPGPVGQLESCPGGRFAYALTFGGAFLLRVRNDGGLALVRRIKVDSGLGLADIPGERDNWGLKFSPSGRFLYDFSGDGFVDHRENYLRRYRVSLRTGRLVPDGVRWTSPGDDGTARSVSADPGNVWCVVKNIAFVKGFANGLWVCRVDEAGRILSPGSRLALHPNSGSAVGQTLLVHPTLPLVVYRGNGADPYTIWRVGIGRIGQVGEFRSAFSGDGERQIASDPSGRFFYETAKSRVAGKITIVAAFTMDDGGTRMRPVSVPYDVPDAADLLFVAPRTRKP